MQSPVPVAAIAYPYDPAVKMSGLNLNQSMDASLTTSQDGNSAEMGENFFSQLDSMIAAVKVESHALFSVKEKLQEMDSLRDQLVVVNRRMVEQEQTNLNLKQSLIQEQATISELRKQKSEADSLIITLRQELNRAKEVFGKERQIKMQLQNEVMQLREQVAKLEKNTETLDRDAKAVPGLMESNDILKNDLGQLRARYKEEKQFLQNQIKSLQQHVADVEMLRNEMRNMGLRMVDIATNCNPGSNGNAGAHGNARAGGGGYASMGMNLSPSRATGSTSYDPYPNPSLTQNPISMPMNLTASVGSLESEYEDVYDEEEDGYDDDSVYTHNTSYYEEDGASLSGLPGMSKVRQTLNRNVYGTDHGLAGPPPNVYMGGHTGMTLNMGKQDKPLVPGKKLRKRRPLAAAAGAGQQAAGPQPHGHGAMRMASSNNNSNLPKI